MTHAPPEPRPPLWTPPARRLVLPPRTPRLRVPRWWRRSPDLLAMAIKPAFKDGMPLFVDGLPAFTEDPCACCGAAPCASFAAVQCPFCPALQTPQSVLAVVSGVSTSCGTLPAASASFDCTTATLSGAFTAAKQSGGIGCAWQYFENATTANTFNFRMHNGSGCASLISQNLAWGIDVDVQDQTAHGRGVVVRARLFGPHDPAFPGFASVAEFAGQAAFTDCYDTYVLTNGTMYDGATAYPPNGGSGGTITLTFCP